MDVLWQDLRHTVKALRRQFGFTAVLVLTLAVGIGVNTAVFTLVHSTLLEPLPYADPDRLVMVWTEIPARGVREGTSAYANVHDWKTQTRIFEELATFDPTTLTLTGGESAEQVSTAKASSNLFATLGVAPLLGRGFSLEEEQQRAAVVVLSHEFWTERFGAAPEAIGETIEIAGNRFRVVGVMPEGFAFPGRNTRLWLPQTLFTDWEATVQQRGTGAWRVIARLQAGVSLDRARAEMRTLATRLEQQYPAANAGLGVNVVSLHEQVTGFSFRLSLWAMFGAVSLVLLLACANAAHLILARGMDRGPEFALRHALGATTPRLIRQAVTENVVLALIAGIAGLLLAAGGLRLLIALAPANLPRLDEVGIDVSVLAYAAAVSLVAGVLFGTAPAVSAARENLFGVLREGRGATARTGGYRARSLLIVFQFTLAIILVFGANLLIRSLLEVRDVDAVFISENVLMANLSVEESARRITFYEQALQEVQAIPGISAAGIIEDLFISGAAHRAIVIEGRPTNEASFEQIRFDAIAGDLLQTVGVQIREGRGFSGNDAAGATPVAIINEVMARRFWPGQSPVGRRFRPGGPESRAAWIEIVGVVGDMRRQGLESEPIAQVFRPFAQEPSRNMNLLVRSDLPVSTLTSTIRARIAAIDRTVPLYHITTVDQALDGYLLQRRFQTYLLGLFSAIAVTLAAVGIYGLIQYSVTRRTHELGVRMALGASSNGLVLMVVHQGLSLALPGLAAGMLCALWLSDTVSALLFGISATDFTNILVPAAILLTTALVASYIPARRAATLDPMTVLRSQ
ncbi:MAG: ABC transporter permease [Longimicrobiales bacterium]